MDRSDIITDMDDPRRCELGEVERLREAYSILKNWIVNNSKPNSSYKYSRCIICGQTWWDDKEEHNFDCKYALSKRALEGK